MACGCCGSVLATTVVTFLAYVRDGWTGYDDMLSYRIMV